MNIKANELFKLLIIISIATACNKTEEVASVVNPNLDPENYAVIPIDEALNTLTTFLSETEMTNTKSGIERTYSTVSTHYSEQPQTKSGDCIPDAYLVNFDDNQGFAILGANTSIAPIIAVVENGNTDWDRLLPKQNNELARTKSEDIGINPEQDLLGPGLSPDQIMTLCVIGALYGSDEKDETETKSGPYTTDIEPLMGYNFQFGQNVTYCHKGSNRFVTNGCASTAISMIISYNNYPKMTVDYSLLDYSCCDSNDGVGYRFLFSDDIVYLKTSDYFTNSGSIPTSLTTDQKLGLLTKIDSHVISDHGTPTVYDGISFKRTRYKLTSGVYYTLSNIIKNWNGTGTMPGAAVDGLEALGYTNVSKTQKSSLTSGQISTIINMLNANKPVLMCGWSLFSLSQSHYWVVDGIRQNSNETLICCNWGHSGTNDGWFSSDCIRENAMVATKSNKKSSGSGNGWNNIIVFSYDMSSSTPNRYVHTFYDEHRVSY